MSSSSNSNSESEKKEGLSFRAHCGCMMCKDRELPVYKIVGGGILETDLELPICHYCYEKVKNAVGSSVNQLASCWYTKLLHTEPEKYLKHLETESEKVDDKEQLEIIDKLKEEALRLIKEKNESIED